MPGITIQLSDEILDLICRNIPYTPTTPNLYVALFTVSPTNTGGGTEVSSLGGSGYARQQLSYDYPASGGIIATTQPVTFGPCTAIGGWGTVVAVGVFDDPVAGKLKFFGPQNPPQTVSNGNSMTVDVGAVQHTLN